MERIKIAVFLIITVLTACTGRARNGTIVINLDKPSSKGFNLEEYCEKIEIISLDETQGLLPRSKFCVFGKGFIIQKDSTCLVVYDNAGRFQQELKFDVIEDFSTFRNKRLYILTADGIEMYGLNDLLYEGRLPLPDTSYTYCKVGGKEDNSVVVLAFRDGRNYSGEYAVRERVFYFPADGGMKGSNSAMKRVLDKSGFFYSETESYYYYSNTGEIYRMEDFYYLSYQWEFKHKEPVKVSISNVQKMSNKLFMQIETDRGTYCLITERDNDYQHSSRLFSDSSTPFFPLGVFYDKANYFLCNSMDIGKYINKELLDDNANNALDSLRAISCNTIIKFSLK